MDSIDGYRADTHALPASTVDCIADRWAPIFRRLDYAAAPSARKPAAGGASR